MTQDQLSFCPWCGDKEHLISQVDKVMPLTKGSKLPAFVIYIVCTICGAHGPQVYKEGKNPNQADTQAAIWEWNKRHVRH